MIPTELLLSIIKTREIVLFPALLEILIMEISFELVREAAYAFPAIGQTLGIIGAVIPARRCHGGACKPHPHYHRGNNGA